jgi:hypothetical protein
MPKPLPAIPERNQLIPRKALFIPHLLKKVRGLFNKIEDHRTGNVAYPLTDVLMSGLAVFSLKYPSLLTFDNAQNEPRIRANLRQLFGVIQAPSDTQLRDVLDPLSPESLRPVVVGVIQTLQQHGALADYKCLGGYLVSMDGTGQFSSNHTSCPECCEKHHRDGTIEYYHQLLASVIVHPDKATVLPLFSEPIIKQDGTTKNDCERNAGKRLLPALRAGFPRMKMIVLEDSLAANGPHIKTLVENNMSYIIRAKPGTNASLMEYVQQKMCAGETDEFEVYDKEQKITRGYRFINDAPLNKTYPDVRVNYLDYWEGDEHGKQKNFIWITDITLSRDNIYHVMRAGRSRWKVENETFNTLKNLGYHFEHNYGHGKQHLATIFALLTMLAFLLDQVQEHSCNLFKATRNKFHSRIALWAKIRGMFTEHYIDDWETFYMAIIYGHKGEKLIPDYPDTS